MHRQHGYNPKRKIAPLDRWDQPERTRRADEVQYGGNPEHKRYPNDYGLDPPIAPRPGKTLCDGEGPFPKAQAEALIAAGLRRGMVSVQMRGEWPQNIWSVRDGVPFEAELDNREQASYHGFPMPTDDSFREIVLREWNARN